VLPGERLPLTRAVSFWHPADGRPVFAVPWEGVILMGTTDVDHPPPIPHDPALSPGEAEYLLAGLRHLFPAQDLSLNDIMAAYAGVRAVINTGKGDPSKESREHILWKEDKLLTVSGGKLTTFRLMARDALRAVQTSLPSHFNPPRKKRVLDPIGEADFSTTEELSPAARLRLFGRYGREAQRVLDSTPACQHQPQPGTETLMAELTWAAQAEGVVHLDDLLLRRVRLGLTQSDGGLEYIDRFRSALQPVLGWPDSIWQKEVNNYSELLSQSYRIR
jgi:glycerol-3-phosphate dehydrogenase